MGRSGGVATGPWGSAADPGAEGIDCFLGQSIFGWHLEVGIFVGDSCEQEALVGVARGEGGAAVATGEEALKCIESEASLFFGLFEAMAAVAGIDEDGADMFFEVGDVFRGGGGGLGWRAEGQGEEG